MREIILNSIMGTIVAAIIVCCCLWGATPIDADKFTCTKSHAEKTQLVCDQYTRNENATKI